jgi:hypothetical protein
MTNYVESYDSYFDVVGKVVVAKYSKVSEFDFYDIILAFP